MAGAVVARPAKARNDDAFWRQGLETLCSALHSSASGLSSRDAAERLRLHGPNDPTAQRQRPGWLRVLARFANPLLVILLFASAVSAATGDVASFAIVVAIIALSVAMDFVQEQRALSAVQALQAKVALRARTLRDGQERSVPVADLVPGDVVRLLPGDLVPADGRLLRAEHLFVNEALLTGESYPVDKRAVDTPPPAHDALSAQGVALAGTTVVGGEATLLIAATGRSTALGELAGTLVGRPPTAFETGLLKFSALILRITVLLVLVVLGESLWFQRGWLDSLMFALALAVGLTPALLPMIVTVTLARGALRMAQRRVIVKRLPAIHNLGAMDVLCTDKTGTLTEAQIRLVRTPDALGSDSRRVFELAWLNSRFETGLKNPMDEAIAKAGSMDAGAWRKLDEVQFDFERRRVSVLLDDGRERLLIVKGAPEDLLRLSKSVEKPGGATAALSETDRNALRAEFERVGMQGRRALGVAYRRVEADHGSARVSDESELVFAGFAVFEDPPKASSGAAVQALEHDGVAVKILTGDNERVAAHLCRELGIAAQQTLTGEELDALSDEALSARVARTTLFCRVSPSQKLRVLMALKRRGKTVGYLGDGINDAPALHAADVGISVDSAADVAKSAAEIVLAAHDLAVLHEGVLEGRRTVRNIDKYILMASSANLGNITSMALAGLFLAFLPLLPIQVLLTNLMYDFGQIALPFDRVDREGLAAPVHWDIRLVERFMLCIGPISTVFDVITFAVLLLLFHADVALFRTGWFIESLATQLLMVFSVRTQRGLLDSRPHGAVMALAVSLIVLTAAMPFLPMAGWFEFVQPPALYYGFLVLALLGFLIAVEAVKRWFYRRIAAR